MEKSVRSVATRVHDRPLVVSLQPVVGKLWSAVAFYREVESLAFVEDYRKS